MTKWDITKKKIYDYIGKNPWISNTDIADFLWVTNVTIFYHLKDLIKNNLVYKTWNTRSTRYFIVDNKQNNKISQDFFNNIKKEISEEYDLEEGLNIYNLLNELLAFLWADWVWIYWIDAFIQKITRENQWNIPNNDLLHKRLISFLLSFFEEERKRRKNGFFEGTQSLNLIMSSYNMDVSIDKLLFTEIATLPHFWRLRTTTELFYWKLDQNKYLLEKAINNSLDIITNYIKKHNITYFLFTPPTLKRKVQFRNILRDLLKSKNIEIHEIKCEKIKSDITHTLRPQKELKWYDRIINARKTIVVENSKIKMDTILIFDDSFTTWATINGIAEKLRFNWYTWNITAITITWNFEYIPGITDIWEI